MPLSAADTSLLRSALALAGVTGAVWARLYVDRIGGARARAAVSSREGVAAAADSGALALQRGARRK